MTRQQPNNKHQGINFENFVEHSLTENNVNISDSAERRWTNEFQQNTEIDRLICDRDGNDLAILEIKSGAFNDVNQAQRLVSLAQQEDLELIFATPDGTTDKFSAGVIRELEKTDFSVINPDYLDRNSQLNWRDVVNENASNRQDLVFRSRKKTQRQHRKSSR